MENATKNPSSSTLIETVRSIYLSRRSGMIDVQRATGQLSLFFRRGELYLDRDDPLAHQLGPLLAATDEKRPAADPELGQALQKLARELAPARNDEVELRSDRAVVVELIGPLPTVCFLEELAIYDSDESELVARLGGEAMKLGTSNKTPALDQLPALEPAMARVLAGIEQPATPAALLRGAGSDRLGFLRALTRLWAIGLVVELGDGSTAGGREILSPKLLRQFSERIAESLEGEPLELDSEAHRQRLAELLAHLGEMNFYQLMGIDPSATAEQIFSAYSELARLVHPSHTESLGFQGKEEGVRILFEKATEAYLTLSDPRRRASYNTVAGVHVEVRVDQAQRREEKRSIAQQNYRRAGSCLSDMDFSLAVDLLKEATRMDPRPEYFARLGLAQSKNPNWHRHAVESYRRAVELDPEDVGIRIGYGQLLEEMDRGDEARVHYEAALQRMPQHPDALLGLERLGAGGGLTNVAAKAGSGFRSLFNRPGKG